MATPKERKASKAAKPKPLDIELAPDAMERFERTMDVMVSARRKNAGKK